MNKVSISRNSYSKHNLFKGSLSSLSFLERGNSAQCGLILCLSLPSILTLISFPPLIVTSHCFGNYLTLRLSHRFLHSCLHIGTPVFYGVMLPNETPRMHPILILERLHARRVVFYVLTKLNVEHCF